MAEVVLTVAGRDHRIACRDGDQAHLLALARRLDTHSPTAVRASGGSGHERTMLYIALMLADELADAEAVPRGGIPETLLERIADRLEAVAAALEEEPPSA